MKSLVVEDDFVSRMILQEMLKSYGPTHIAVNGKEAVAAVTHGLESGEPYELVCLDIMMPEMDGLAALEAIRKLEHKHYGNEHQGTKIIMTTARDDIKTVISAYDKICDAYLVKPLDAKKLNDSLKKLELVEE